MLLQIAPMSSPQTSHALTSIGRHGKPSLFKILTNEDGVYRPKKIAHLRSLMQPNKIRSISCPHEPRTSCKLERNPTLPFSQCVHSFFNTRNKLFFTASFHLSEIRKTCAINWARMTKSKVHIYHEETPS